jgi:hypothetical protein
MADKITKIVEIEIDVKSGELKILDAELNKIIGKKAKLNDQQKAENETTSAAIGLIDKFTGGLASSAEGWFKMGKNAVKALTGIKSGLISTGIGALVVGLGLVVAYWDEITSFLGFANDEQEDLNKQTDLYNAKLRTTAENLNTLSATNKKRILDEAEANGEAIDDLEVQIRYLQELSDSELKKLSEAEKAYEKRAVAAKGFFESEESYLERTKQEFERRSKVEQEISDIEEKRLTLFEQIRKLKQQQSDEVLAQIKEEDSARTAAQEKANALLQKYLDLKLTLEQAHSLALIEDDRQRQLKAIEFELENNKRSIENSEFTEKQKAALSELYYTQWLDKKTQLSDTWSAEDEAKRIAEEQKAIARQDELEGIRTQILKDGIDKEILLAMQKGDALYAQAEGDAELQIEITKATEAAIQEIKDRYAKEDAKKQLKDAQELNQAKMGLAIDAFGALIALNNAFAGATEQEQRKAFQRDKALKIGQAIMSTGLAVTAALTAGGNPIKLATGMQFIEAGIAGAMGLAQVAAITKTQFNPSGGSSGGGVPSVSAPTATAQAPQFNTVGTSGFNQLSDSIAVQNQRPVQAYVVANDVSSAQSLDRNRVRQASFP